MQAETREILPKIYKFCAYQERCFTDIRQRLITWEVPRQDFDAVFQHLKAEGFWDEFRYATAFVRGKFSLKRWGRIKIRHGLRKKGVSNGMIEAAINKEIHADDYQMCLEYLIDKRVGWPVPQLTLEEKSKLFQYLQQKGFEWGEISEVVG